ncbi:MAG: sulfatase [Verrucomicrobiota bacterium]
MRFLTAFFLLALLCSGAVLRAGAAAATTPRPNVLFLAVDDMNDWPAYLGGYPGKVHTPHLDALAKRGVAFLNAHCASPLCNPSRTAILTGRMPSTSGIYGNSEWWRPSYPDLVTLPDYFKRNGYQVAGAGKIHHHTAGSNPPYQWDHYEPLVFRDDPWFRDNKLNYPWSKSTPPPPEFPFSKVAGLPSECDWGVLPIAEADYDDARTAAYSIDFLKKASTDKPFFLACGIFRPHLPWYVPQRYLDLYPLDKIVIPEIPADDLDDIPAAGRKIAARTSEAMPTIKAAGAWSRAIQAYLASISYADAQIGRVLEALAQSPHAARTIVVLWSDHGYHVGEKHHWNKSTLWERATRIPFIVVAPGVTPTGGRSTRPVNLIDLYPTLVSLAGLPTPAGLDGRDLTPLLRDPAATWERPSITEFNEGNASARSERYRYIRYEDGSEELYDHRTDPNEWRNLAADPAYAAIKADHARWLPTRWAKAVPGKKAFDFDPTTYSWKNRATGQVIR